MLEQFANAPNPSDLSAGWTTLQETLDASTTTVRVVSNFAFPQTTQFRILIENEWLLVVGNAGTNVWTVVRGIEDSTAAPHAAGLRVFHVLTAGGLARNPRSMRVPGDIEYLDSNFSPASLAGPVDGDYVMRWTGGVPSWSAAPTSIGLTVDNFASPNVSQWANDVSYATTGYVDAVRAVPPSAGSNKVLFDNGTTYSWSDSLVVSELRVFTPNSDQELRWRDNGLSVKAPTAGDETFVDVSIFDPEGNAIFGNVGQVASTYLFGIGGEVVLDAVIDHGPIAAFGYGNQSSFDWLHGNVLLFGRALNPTDDNQTWFGDSQYPVYLNSSGTVFKLPTADGTDGQVMATDGSGNLSFISIETISLTVSNFASPNISQWTNDAAYTTATDIAGLGYLTTASAAVTYATISAVAALSSAVSASFSALGTAAYTASSAYEVPLTFSTGLTRTTNTITINTSQNIATLSNLTTDGLVKTSGGTGTLSIDTTAYTTLAAVAGVGYALTTNPLSQFAGTTSAQLASVMSDETGSGALVFATSPTLVTPTLGVASGTSLAVTSTITTTQSIGAVSTDGIILANTTAAAAGAQQWSPRIRLTGQGWKTNSTAASQSTDWVIENKPVQGAANPTSTLSFSTSVAGGSSLAYFTINGDGINAGAATIGNATLTVDRLITASNGVSGAGWCFFGGSGSTTGGVGLGSGHAVTWGSSTTNSGNTGDTYLVRDGAANTLALRNSTNAQTFNIYNTYTDSSNYERAAIYWSANEFTIAAQKAGTGSARNVTILSSAGGSYAYKTYINTANNYLELAHAGVWTASNNGGVLEVGGGSGIPSTSGNTYGVKFNTGANPSSTSTMVFAAVHIAPTINYSAATPGAGSYEALKIAVTETALPTGTSYLIRGSAGSAGTTDKFYVLNDGSIFSSGAITASDSFRYPSSGTNFNVRSNTGMCVSSGMTIGFSSGASNANSGPDTYWVREAAYAIGQRNGTNAQTYYLYNTYTDASNYERLAVSWSLSSGSYCSIRTESAGTGTQRQLRFLFGGSASTAMIIPAGLGVITMNNQDQYGTVDQFSGGKVSVGGGGRSNATSGTDIGLLVSGGAIPTSTSTLSRIALKISDQINYSAVTPGAGSWEALKIAVTETANPTGTNYFIRASGGSAGTTDKFTVDNNGTIRARAGGYNQIAYGFAGQNANTGIYGSDSGISFDFSGGVTLNVGPLLVNIAGVPLTFAAAGGGGDTFVYRDAADVLALRHTTTGQTWRVYNTYTDSSNGEWLTTNWASNVLHIGTAKNGTGTARVMQFDYGGTTTAAISIPITSGSITLGGGLTMPDAGDIVLGTTTGTKVGTSNTQKLGFYGATPIVQAVLATGAAHTADDIITALQNLGLVSQS